jgi:hypothetical protein
MLRVMNETNATDPERGAREAGLLVPVFGAAV